MWAAPTPDVSSPRCSTRPAPGNATLFSPRTRRPTVPISKISPSLSGAGGPPLPGRMPTVDYWRGVTQHLLSDSASVDSEFVRLAYSKLAAEQSSLLSDRKSSAEGEQMLHYATQIAPASPEAVFRYVNLLVDQNRYKE